MERGSNPASPRKDDEKKHELEGYLRSGQHTHVEEAHDPEPVAEDDVRVDPGGPVPPAGLERDQAEERAAYEAMRLELARALDRQDYPADRDALVRALLDRHAPDTVVTAVQDLPEGGSYHTTDEVAQALRPAR
ncbi:DUF2795 domain-containing protein [Streptomyces sp. TRM64462]|uniref:DUF2795 domain-containing protein n=1 Tax=Streptomyces sp. TRM64462 TaxID=2741726 RepID=UPI001586BF87|nr:DUF2795 domain-containing protein [Streptomyces sp. TRM64462]